MPDTSIQENVTRVRERIEQACGKAGRSVDEVTLVAVTKTHGPDKVREACECGLTIVGENRVQEALSKAESCPGQLHWHLIGHLQRNKVRKALSLFEMIHSIDSARLLETVDTIAGEIGGRLPAMLEVNVSGESSKYGLDPESLPDVLESAAHCRRVDVVGLMTMPPWSSDPEKARPHFARLRALLQRCGDEWGFPMTELSMGMSHDFEVAIEEGATYIRVGSALFGGREP